MEKYESGQISGIDTIDRISILLPIHLLTQCLTSTCIQTKIERCKRERQRVGTEPM